MVLSVWLFTPRRIFGYDVVLAPRTLKRGACIEFRKGEKEAHLRSSSQCYLTHGQP